MRGEQATDPVSQLDLDAARSDWDHVYQRVLAGREKIAESQRELSALGKWVAVHSQPTMAHDPVGRKSGDSMGEIILQSLAVGLSFALLAPYLLEFAFPRRRAIYPRQGTCSDATENVDFTGEPANI